MLAHQEAVLWTADIKIISMLFFSWQFEDVYSERFIPFCTWFGDHVTVPRMTEAIYTPMSLNQILAYTQLNDRPPHLIRDMELSYRGHVLIRAHEICESTI